MDILEHTCISNRGISINKTKLNDDVLIEVIRNDLTIKPIICQGYGNEESALPYKLFLENTDKIYVPYYYGIKKLGNVPNKTKLLEPDIINLQFASNREMRPYQKEIISTYMSSARSIGGGIISVGCGRGKTVMALKILQELGFKTLILVHKEFLMNQWVERIKEYLPEAKIGYIQGKTLDIRDKDIVLAMIQSLSDPRKDGDYPPEIFQGFGLLIVDECHHMAARQFVRALNKYTYKHTLGLSATPKRSDGLEKVFKFYLGDIVYKDSEIQKTEADKALDHIPDSTVKIYKYDNIDPKYSKECLNFNKKPNIVVMKGNISRCYKRTHFLLSFLPELIKEGRTILILSSLRNHISQMYKMINSMKIPDCTVGLYVGGMKQSDLDKSALCRIIIATFNMAEEAFDCKTLNTLIYATPHKNIEQAVGRILREEKKKRIFIPLIIDIQDMFSSFKRWNSIREKYYKNKNYPIEYFTVDDNKEKPIIEIIQKNNKKDNLDIDIDVNDGEEDDEEDNNIIYDLD